MIHAEIVRALFGLLVFIGIAWLLSERKRGFPIRSVLIALGYQVLLAVVLTRAPLITDAFGVLAHAVSYIQASAQDGAVFVFGYLGGGATPFQPVTVGSPAASPAATTFIFAFQALPAILLVSALSALLWHWGLLRAIVRASAWVFGRLFGVSGPVGVSTSACIFLGMVEAPLLVRPLLPRMSRGELFIIMVDGMSVVAGAMMILLGSMLEHRVPNAFTHLLTASLISTPMAIGLARAIVPEPASCNESPFHAPRMELKSGYRNSLDAIIQGTVSAGHMAVNIIALLIVFIGLVALLDRGLALIPHDGAAWSLGGIFGWLLSPVAWLMGVPDGELRTVGGLLGTKLSMNEVVAYGELARLPQGALSEKGALIATYALCSFGNIGSVAILIGIFNALAPEKSNEMAALGFKALAAAFITTCMTGSIIGVLHSFT